ncbi:MAG: hypothetical protein IV086_09025 [Hyphomonadaceae bacterium]|nr:MAG: putative membrane protein [Caulobacteraceae bacterium]MBT9445825.1 hypothetical protein [Hyphomonadaceae bacterium]
MNGKFNIAVGLWFLAGFMVYGFVLIYLRDFAPGREQWVADYAIGKHFESRLAHVHGNLFALLNVLIGYLLVRLPVAGAQGRWIAALALAGMLMPLGILSEVWFGVPPILVIVGGVAMIGSMIWLGLAVWRLKLAERP